MAFAGIARTRLTLCRRARAFDSNSVPQQDRRAYGGHLASRIRRALDGSLGFSEKTTFGGVCFLRRGLMLAGASTLMARVGKATHEDSLVLEHVRVMDFSSKPMTGCVFVDEPGIATERALNVWLGRCLDFVATLPPKAGR